VIVDANIVPFLVRLCSQSITPYSHGQLFLLKPSKPYLMWYCYSDNNGRQLIRVKFQPASTRIFYWSLCLVQSDSRYNNVKDINIRNWQSKSAEKRPWKPLELSIKQNHTLVFIIKWNLW